MFKRHNSTFLTDRIMSAPPAYGQDDYTDSTTEKFIESPKRNDVLWSIMFVLHLVVLLVLAIANFSAEDSTGTQDVDISPYKTEIISITFTYLVAGIGMALVWLKLMESYASCLVWFTLLAGAAATLVLALLFLAMGNAVLGVIFLVFFALNCFYVYYVRDRIPFAVAVIETTVQAFSDHPQPAFVAFGSMFAQAAWIALWSAAAYSSMKESGTDAVGLFFLISFYWSAQVISYVVFVTAAGVFAEWYFTHPSVKPSVTTRSFKRAMGTSFGSICYGAFVIAVIRALKEAARRSEESDNQIARCILLCILSCFEAIIEFVNKYAFTYVAIYGMDYCGAAKTVWDLIKNRGWDVVINDDLVGNVLAFGYFFSGCIVAVISWFVAYVPLELSSETSVYVALGGFFAGMVFSFCSLTVVDAGAATLLVCFCEDPATLSRNQPPLYSKMSQAFNARYHNLSV